MYVEILVAVSHFLPLEDAAPLFQACMEPERSDAVKTCAIHASLTFVQVAARFSWHRSFDGLAATVVPRCHDILGVCPHFTLKLSAYMRSPFLIEKSLLWASCRYGEQIPIFLWLGLRVWMCIRIGLSLPPSCGKHHSTLHAEGVQTDIHDSDY